MSAPAATAQSNTAPSSTAPSSTAPSSTAATTGHPDATGAERVVRVGLLGAGVVGSQVIRLLQEQGDELASKVGGRLELAAIAVRDPAKHRQLPAELITTDAAALVARTDLDVIVEVMGGIHPARELLLTALERGAGVVTANKALLAEEGPVLYEAADAAGADLYYEAAVAGAIPLIRPLRESLAGDRISRVMGIVNGTTNYILWSMTAGGDSYDTALAEATRLGYAEADPTADVEGFDAAAKAAILASICFHTRVAVGDVHREGMSTVTAADVRAAARIGCVIKLLAICERVVTDDGESVSARVHPVMLPSGHALASVDGAYNAVYVEAESAGRLMFSGPGAGGSPTASAVLGDLVAVARNKIAGGHGPRESSYADLPIRSMGDVPTRYHVNLDVEDRAGVLAAVATEFAARGVSIATVRQEGAGDGASLVIVSHEARDSALSETVRSVAQLPGVRAVASVMRVTGDLT